MAAAETKIIIIAGPNGAGKTTLARVAARVRQGGHDIPPAVIHRRFSMGWDNFQRHYRQAVDDRAVYDNTGTEPTMLEWGENR